MLNKVKGYLSRHLKTDLLVQNHWNPHVGIFLSFSLDSFLICWDAVSDETRLVCSRSRIHVKPSSWSLISGHPDKSTATPAAATPAAPPAAWAPSAASSPEVGNWHVSGSWDLMLSFLIFRLPVTKCGGCVLIDLINNQSAGADEQEQLKQNRSTFVNGLMRRWLDWLMETRQLRGGGEDTEGLQTLSGYQSAALTLFLLLLLFHLLQHLPRLLQLLLCVRRMEPLPEMSKAPIIVWGRLLHVFVLWAVVT